VSCSSQIATLTPLPHLATERHSARILTANPSMRNGTSLRSWVCCYTLHPTAAPIWPSPCTKLLASLTTQKRHTAMPSNTSIVIPQGHSHQWTDSPTWRNIDADFCRLFGIEDVHDPSCVKSRTGFIITVASCPVLWVSRLPTAIAVSTVESEFAALSQSMRALIPLQRIMEEINSAFHLTDSPIPYTTKSNKAHNI
jgi:hypothetical protein